MSGWVLLWVYFKGRLCLTLGLLLMVLTGAKAWILLSLVRPCVAEKSVADLGTGGPQMNCGRTGCVILINCHQFTCAACTKKGYEEALPWGDGISLAILLFPLLHSLKIRRLAIYCGSKIVKCSVGCQECVYHIHARALSTYCSFNARPGLLSTAINVDTWQVCLSVLGPPVCPCK